MLFCCLSILAFTSCSSPKTTAQFYQTYKSRPGVTNFKLPGWVVWLGGGIAYNSINNESTKTALRFARKVGKMRLMASENGTFLPESELQAFIENIKGNGYEELIQVESKGSSVNIMVRDRRDKIKNLLLLVRDEDGFVFMDLKTRIRYDEVADLINYMINMGDDEKAEDTKPTQEAAPAVPRA